MKPHVKAYYDHFDLGEQDIVLCEYCSRKAVDCHHLVFRSQGGGNSINNLVALCRECHNRAHSDKVFNNRLKELRDG